MMNITPIKYECWTKIGIVYIERTGDEWAITNGREVLSDKMTWDREPIPSSRTKEYLDSHRFSFEKCKEMCLSLEEKS